MNRIVRLLAALALALVATEAAAETGWPDKPELKTKFANLGLDTVGSTPGETQAASRGTSIKTGN